MGELSVWIIWLLGAFILGKLVTASSNWTLFVVCVAYTIWWLPVMLHVPQVWTAILTWRF